MNIDAIFMILCGQLGRAPLSVSAQKRDSEGRVR